MYKFTKRLADTASVKQKQTLVLECMISDPRPTVKWTKDGETIEVGSKTSLVVF